MNMVEKTSTGVTPAQLILNNSISLSKQILMSQRVLHMQDTTRSTGQIALSDRMDEWISKQNTLIKVASKKQSKTDHHALVEYDPAVTEYPINSYLLFISPLAIAKQNEQEFVVESITGHRGNRQRRSTMEFKFRWAGLESHTIVGSHIKLSCMSTSSTIICEPMQ